MINFIELTHYKMINELYNNRHAKIVIIKIDFDGKYSAIEIDSSITNCQLANILNDKSEKHIFIRGSDYNQLCKDSYSEKEEDNSMQS